MRGPCGLVALLLCGGCAGGTQDSAGGRPAPIPATLGAELALVAEGPCAKLAAYDVAGERVLVYGDTGYELADWTAGERLATAQSMIAIEGTRAGRAPRLTEGLPRDDRGYVPFDLQVERDSLGAPWLLLTDRRYAQHGKGVLFDDRVESCSLAAEGWRKSGSASPVDLGRTKALPEVPVAEACEDAKLHFVPLAHTYAADGTVLVAGRCQDESHIAYAETTLVVALARPGKTEWEIGRPPRSSRLDGIVNLGLFARRADDAWLVAYEPFVDPKGRHSFLSHWDGRAWREVDVGVDAGFMSVAGTDDGAIYLAAGSTLVKLPPNGAAERVALPPPRFVEPAPEQHITRVSVFQGGELWVESSYRVFVPTTGPDGGGDRKVWASALYSNRRLESALHCDAAEPAERALTTVKGPDR